MKVIFLDIDGVLNNNKTWGNRPPIKSLDQSCIQSFNKIIDATNTQIVISSTWRMLFEYADLCNMLKDVGMRGVIIGKTPTVGLSGHRGKEIKTWLEDSQSEIDGFVVLDDETYDMGNIIDHVIKIDNKLGLTDAMADIIIERLKGNGSLKSND